MKYIKLFENFENKAYKEISSDEYLEILDDTNSKYLSFTDVDHADFKNFKIQEKMAEMYFSNDDDQYVIYSKCIFIINKANDDHFLVCVQKFEPDHFERYFVCDQVHGVEDLYNYFMNLY